MNTDKKILDACCSTRMMWFDKEDERCIYADKREDSRIIDVGTPGTKGRKPKNVKPDIIADFRKMPFKDETFHHVVFDPPHFYKGAGKTGRIAFDYGLLDETWRDDIRAGFAECLRVLKPSGTLIFKWCEVEIPLREILKLTDANPLYGHRSGKKALTHWVAFIKESRDSDYEALLAEFVASSDPRPWRIKEFQEAKRKAKEILADLA